MILIMFSGGLDSAGALYKLLTETTQSLHVHHIDLQNIENRWIPERYAVSNILQYCKEKIRDFKITTSTYEFKQFNTFFTWDNDIVRFVAAQICKGEPGIIKVALGKCADDNIDPSFKLRSIQAQAIWNSCFIESARPAPEIIRPVENLTKKEIWDLLPDEIKKFSWSCRTPIFNRNIFSYCTQCITCQSMIKHGILKGPTQNIS